MSGSSWTACARASSAKSLRAQPDGKVLSTDGPYLETKEHIGGFWVLEAADLDEALASGRKAAVACRAPVRCVHFTDGGPTKATKPRKKMTFRAGCIMTPLDAAERAPGGPC